MCVYNKITLIREQASWVIVRRERERGQGLGGGKESESAKDVEAKKGNSKALHNGKLVGGFMQPIHTHKSRERARKRVRVLAAFAVCPLCCLVYWRFLLCPLLRWLRSLAYCAVFHYLCRYYQTPPLHLSPSLTPSFRSVKQLSVFFVFCYCVCVFATYIYIYIDIYVCVRGSFGAGNFARPGKSEPGPHCLPSFISSHLSRISFPLAFLFFRCAQ